MLDITDFPWAECAITENRAMYISDSLSLKRSKRNTGVQRIEIELVTIDMDMSQGRGIKAKLSAATDDILLYKHPRLSYSQGTEPVEGIEVSGSTNASGDKTISLTSFGVWQLLAGDWMQFSNDTKVYECAEDTSLALGQKNVKLNTPLRHPLTDGTSVTVNGVELQLISDGLIEVGMTAVDNQDMQLTLVAVEKL